MTMITIQSGGGETRSATDNPERVHDARGEGQGHCRRLQWWCLPRARYNVYAELEEIDTTDSAGALKRKIENKK